MNQLPPPPPETEYPVRILAVDDDPQIVELLAVALGSFGFDYDTARDGREALDKLETGGFNLVLTDMTMPRLDGMTLLKEIKNRWPRLSVIVITGYAQKYSYTDVIRAGACDFIAKPFNIDELEAKLRRVLREQELVRRLEHLSLCDALTGLYNRRGFEARLHEEVPRAHRQGYPVFLAQVDLDHFKPCNDQFGHRQGDEVLKAVGRLLMGNTRENVDWCCRQGGDEFAVILPYATEDQALAVCRRILAGYRRIALGETSLSIGLARFRRHNANSWEQDIAELIEQADQAMYRAKKAGGDRIACAAPLSC